MIDRRNISYTQGGPTNPVHRGKLVAPPIDSTPKIKRGEVVSRRVRARPAVIEDPVANIIDVVKYGSLGLGGPILATIEHATGKQPTVISTGYGIATSAMGIPGAVAYATTTLPAVVDKGIIGTDPTTTFQPAQVQQAVSQVPLIDASTGVVKLDLPKLDLGLPSFDDLKTPLLIVAGLIGTALFLPSIIGAFKK